MTASLAYRKNEAAILRGDVPPKFLQLLPFIPMGRTLEIGSAEGVLALLMAKHGYDVAAIEKSEERYEAALDLRDQWVADYPQIKSARFFKGDIRDNLFLFNQTDTLIAIRSIYYLGDALVDVFAEAARKVPNVVLCGNGNRAGRWRQGNPDPPLLEWNRYAAREGMIELLERHGYRIVKEGSVNKGDEVVVGRLG